MPKQNVAVELYYDSAWHDIAATDDVFADTPIRIQRGQGDESAAFRPAKVSMSLANDDDIYRTSNPESPLYGKAGRNTPIRVSVGGTVRGYAEAASWSPDQTPDFRVSPPRGKAWVELEAGGLLQRIGQWTEPLRSPFHYYNANLPSSVGYWPMEDVRGSRTLYTPTPGATSTTLRGVEFESQTRFAGSAPMLVFPDNPNTLASGRFAPGDVASTAGWQLSFCINFGSIGSTGGFYEFISWTTADGTFYSLSWVDGVNLHLLVDNGSTLIDHDFGIGAVSDWNRWQNFVMRATYSGGTTTISTFWNTEGSSVFAWAGDQTFSGVPSSLAYWQMQSGGAFNDVSAGHVLGTAGTSDDLTSTARMDAFAGHAGELAAVRFGRLMDQKGVPYYVSGSWADSMPMGPQQVDTFPNLVKEIVTTEDALLFDHRTEGRVYFLCRLDRYNQTPVLDLTPADLPALPREVTDDLDVHNVVTASQREGGDATAEDSTGPLGTQPPPDGAGEYRQTVDVNIDDEDDLPQIANWWLRRGTVDLPRFPQLTVDLGAKSGLIDAVEAVEVGSVITISGFREYTIRLYVLGYTETIGTHTRTITFTCAPDLMFQVGTWVGDWTNAVVLDTFSRLSTNGWGTATTGQAWSTSGGSAGDYSVEGG